MFGAGKKMNSSASTTPLNTYQLETRFRGVNDNRASVRPKRDTYRMVLAILPLLLLLAVVIAIIIILWPSSYIRSSSKKDGFENDGLGLVLSTQDKCHPSEEAKRCGLHGFLNRLKKSYFRLHPERIPSKLNVTSEEVRQRYRPYDPRPSAIKKYTDETKQLHEQLLELITKTDESKLKLRERKVVHVVLSYLLKHSFEWGPYERDYYAGDWMLEPNMYCWQPICDVINNLLLAIDDFKPTDLQGVERLKEVFGWHKNTIIQYVENMKMGVTRGMVRSKRSCRAGFRALTRIYRNIALHNETGILEGHLATAILDPEFLKQITPEMNRSWIKKHGVGVRESLKYSLVDMLGKPIVTLLRYMEFEHLRHCASDDKFSGLHSLPLSFQYVDDAMDNSRPTIKTLPTGEPLNGSRSYLRLFSFFTQNDVTPEELRMEGYEKLDQLLKKVKEIAKIYTKEDNETTAVMKFRQVLESQDMFYNSDPFPANESDENAFMKCGDAEGARKFCPKRWEAFQRWMESINQISEHITLKLETLFYYTGAKKTSPKCNISVIPDLNPDVCFHGYQVGVNSCADSAFQTLPFFMDDFGPKYTDHTTTVHEQLPGHHLEVQGFTENFVDKCDDSIYFFSEYNYIPAFTEGWATYVEYPLISRNTDIYSDDDNKEVLLRKYGMYKYQILAALRSVLDSGINYFGMKKSEAVELFDKYAWDTSDLVTKDITRFQSAPGTVTSYMMSQALFARVMELAQKELGSSFSFSEFHYQILRQGEVPLDYLEQHIRRYIQCSKDSSRDGCSEILGKN